MFATVFAVCLFTTVYSQSCSVATLPMLNGVCPTGFTEIGTACCPNDCYSVGCADKMNPNSGVSDCPNYAAYCTRSDYLDFMKEQCPFTCGYCGATCADKVNPSTGISDCPASAFYCTDSRYASFMKTECPKTCGYC